ncbi:MAG: LPS-assembly protein LptD [Candidatus Omnitrophica bacterium]|nr:LPS-assembly protein LptD [Candidatus Omnitrophota bacterium]
MPDFLRRGFGSIPLLILLGAAFFIGSTSAAYAQKEAPTEEVPIEVSGDQLEYIRGENKIIASGNVLVSYKTIKMTCDKVEVFTDSKKAYAEGHVYIYFESGQVLRGDKVYYDFKNRQGSFPNGRVITDKWFARGEQIEQVSRNEIRIFNAVVTTCPYDRPHYDVRAKRVTIYPGDKIVARDVVFQVLGRSIFWWPYFVIPLDIDEAPIQIAPGYSDEYGFYVLMSKTTSLNKHVKIKGNIDYRSKKGVGGGVDIKYAFEKLGSGVVNTYLARDESAPDDKISTIAGDPFSDRVVENRGRVSTKHRMDIDKYTNVITEWNFFSDEFFMQEFFEREYQREIQPRSFMAFTKNTERYGFLIDVEKRTNRFFSTLERLPEIRYTWNRREIMNSNFYYRAEHQFVNYNKKFANASSEDADVVRFDSFNELSYPIKLFHWQVTPFGNVRETFYSKNKFGEHNVERHIIGNGVDVSTRFYKTYDFNTRFAGLDINRIRHIFEPSLRYTANREVSVSPGSLQIFDGVDDQFLKDEFVFGFENRLQTKRYKDGVWHRVDVVSFNTFLTYSYDDYYLNVSKWTRWRQEIQARPYDWLIGQTIWEFNMASGQFSVADVDLILEKQPLRVLIGHRFEKQDQGFGGKSLFQFDVNWQITPLWALGGYMRTEFDTNTVEEWEVRATRDLHDWYFDFGYNVRHSEIDSADKELFFELRLKAFPQFPLKGGNRATFSRPRIGHFVSGANQTLTVADNTSTTPQYSS